MTGPITRPQRIIRRDPGEPTDLAASRRVQRGSLGPFWKRMGALGLVAVFAISIALAVASRSPLDQVAALAAPASSAAGAVAATDQVATVLPPPTSLDDALTPGDAVAASAGPVAAPVPQTKLASSTAATRSCTKSYKIVAGDYWILIAKKTSITLKSLLNVNSASTSTPLYAGRTVCLPGNASTPTTVQHAARVAVAAPKAPSTTARAAAKVTATTAKPAAAPATTSPPSTTPSRTYSAAEAEQIIRDVWPDDLEDHAVLIAKRESNLQPTARNYCCIGLFQIYWSVHRFWLAAIGVSSANSLLDPRINASAAYVLYLRNGGWGPWAL
ncbi:unannotated protein [freshwater metagenome]|uniref:Unannotated protein n=1 Tax=freshwater metagenome TaxID=449393 RepID=A0A6J7FQY9_9ZZZZ